MEKDIDLVKGKMAVELEGEYYNAHALPLDHNLMVEDEAYIHNNMVLPYRGEIEAPDNLEDMSFDEMDEQVNKLMKKPGFYKLKRKDGSTVVMMQEPVENVDAYGIEKVMVLDISKLVDRIASEDFLSPEAIEQLNMSSDYREFTINPDDDFLKVIVKTVINTKKINLKIFASRLPKRHNLSNMINSLDSATKMSVKYFSIWKELLEFEFDLNVWDNDHAIVPMEKTIRYDSLSGDVDIRE